MPGIDAGNGPARPKSTGPKSPDPKSPDRPRPSRSIDHVA
ncbi:hypothetical protein [Azospirillum palustre]